MDLISLIEKYVELSVKRDYLINLAKIDIAGNKHYAAEFTNAKSNCAEVEQLLIELQNLYYEKISSASSLELKEALDTIVERKQDTLDQLDEAIQRRDKMRLRGNAAFDDNNFELEQKFNKSYSECCMKVTGLQSRANYYDTFVKNLIVKVDKDISGPKL